MRNEFKKLRSKCETVAQKRAFNRLVASFAKYTLFDYDYKGTPPPTIYDIAWKDWVLDETTATLDHRYAAKGFIEWYEEKTKTNDLMIWPDEMAQLEVEPGGCKKFVSEFEKNIYAEAYFDKDGLSSNKNKYIYHFQISTVAGVDIVRQYNNGEGLGDYEVYLIPGGSNDKGKYYLSIIKPLLK